MYRAVRVVTLATLVASGCAHAKYGASFKTASGNALAPVGMAGGTTNIVRVADASGPLSRAALIGLATLTAAGAYKETSRSTTTERVGDYIVTTTTTTGTVDQAQAQRAAALADSAFSSEPVGLQASLDIATRYLGGDTSGWMYQVGYNSEPFACGPVLACRFYGGLGFGSYTFHDRMIEDASGTRMGDGEYNYIGFPLRLEVAPASFLAGFIQADLNTVTLANIISSEEGSPSPWHVGVDLRFKWIYGRMQQTFGQATLDDRTTTFEVGLGF